ncbi:MAG: hypothetical protein IKO10_03670 [Lachnospiraceae bacterium]|nr:hypothetical protein [Lachnospiraceae bacterium]
MRNKDEIKDYKKKAQRLDAMHAVLDEYLINHIIKTLKEKGFCVSKTDFAIACLNPDDFNGSIVFQPQGEEITALTIKWGYARGTDYNDFLEAIKKYIKEKENDEIDR